MAPGQVPHHNTPWRDAHSFYLLSPLMGFLSRAWSLLRGPGPSEPWLLEAVIEENGVADSLEREAKSPLTTSLAPWGRHSQGQAEDSRASKEDGEAVQGPCLNLNANSFPPEARGLSDNNDKAHSEEEANSIFREQRRAFTDGQPASLSPSLPERTLQASDKSPGEEQAEEEGVAVSQGVTKFSYFSSHGEGCPVDEEEVGDAVRGAPEASTFPISLGSKPSTWASCPGEEEDRATEEKGSENKKARKTSISSSSSGFNCATRGDSLGRVPKEKGKKADPRSCSSVPAQRGLLRAWEHQPLKNTEEEDEDRVLEAGEEGAAEGLHIPLTSTSRRAWAQQPGEDTEEEEDSNSGSADEGEAGAPPIPPTSAFLKAWVYHPGEDTEEEDTEEDDDSDLQSAEEEGDTEAAFPTSSANAFVRSWVYRPGEDTEEEDTEEDDDSDLQSDEEEGETEATSPTSCANAFVKSWVYRPGEDTEEDEEEEDKDSDSGSAEEEGEAKASSPTPTSSAFLKAWVYQPGEDTEEEDACEDDDDNGDDSEAAEGGRETESRQGWIHPPGAETEEWEESEPRPFRVAIYTPGKKPPVPWAAPKLPLRLQRRLRLSETTIQDPDPGTPLKARKVRFSEKVSIRLLVVWAGPAQAARRGPWEQFARDRSRFARRIARAEEELGPCLTPASRARAWERLGNPPASGPHACPAHALPSQTPGHALPAS